MITINYFDGKKRAWVAAEKDGKPIVFADEYEADEWMQNNQAAAFYRNAYSCRLYIVCEVCGAEVDLGGFTNTCDNCDTDYNGSGHRLAPREQWGWETGETAADILGVDTVDEAEG